jgi:hypothetical protein
VIPRPGEQARDRRTSFCAGAGVARGSGARTGQHPDPQRLGLLVDANRFITGDLAALG